MERLDAVVVGAGVVGLAVARALAMAGREVVILEAEDAIGVHTSSRNSEVIHAGIYYPKGSLRARSCVAGRERLYEYCVEHGVPHRRSGKLIVATDEGPAPGSHREQIALRTGPKFEPSRPHKVDQGFDDHPERKELRPAELERGFCATHLSEQLLQHQHVQRLPAGTRLSYGRWYQLDRDATVVTVPIGYGDGVRRTLATGGGTVLIAGERHPIAGTITMDQLMVDVGDVSVGVGDEVVLLGAQEAEEITAAEWAARIETISYEIVCGIGARVPRRYVGGEGGSS